MSAPSNPAFDHLFAPEHQRRLEEIAIVLDCAGDTNNPWGPTKEQTDDLIRLSEKALDDTPTLSEEKVSAIISQAMHKTD